MLSYNFMYRSNSGNNRLTLHRSLVSSGDFFIDNFLELTMGKYVEQLTEEIQRLQREEGLVDLNVYRDGDEMATQEEVAKGMLQLMSGEKVSDPEVF